MLDFTIDRPVVFFDLETTGTSFQNDRIVEISVVKVLPTGEREVKTRRVNPEMRIPRQSTEIHGISDEDVKDAPTFKAIAKNLYIYLEGCDLGGYNVIRFDVPMLIEEFRRAGLNFSTEGRRLVDPYVIFCLREPRDLSAAYQKFCGKEMVGAHGAEADILATIEVLNGQLAAYGDLPRDLPALAKLCIRDNPGWVDSAGKFAWRDDDAVVNFGKYSGSTLKFMASDNPGFLKWMLNNDFPDDSKEIAANALKGVFPKP